MNAGKRKQWWQEDARGGGGIDFATRLTSFSSSRSNKFSDNMLGITSSTTIAVRIRTYTQKQEKIARERGRGESGANYRERRYFARNKRFSWKGETFSSSLCQACYAITTYHVRSKRMINTFLARTTSFFPILALFSALAAFLSLCSHSLTLSLSSLGLGRANQPLLALNSTQS